MKKVFRILFALILMTLASAWASIDICSHSLSGRIGGYKSKGRSSLRFLTAVARALVALNPASKKLQAAIPYRICPSFS